MRNAQIVSVATELAPNRVPIAEVEARILAESRAKRLPVSFIRRLTGVTTVYHRSDGMQTSDLAAAAAKTALSRAGLTIHDIDLLLFASASQDLIEPATSHIVAAKLGARGTPVMDIKNACNSFLNGVQVANSFIRSNQYNRILIVSGETPSMAVRWDNESKEQFLRSFPGFSMSDAGGAMIVQGTGGANGVHAVEFTALSDKWDVGTLAAGGSMRPRDDDAYYFDMDGGKLFDAFLSLGPEILNATLRQVDLTWEHFAFIGMHQISLPYLSTVCDILGVPMARTVPTIQDFGNVTSISLPLQLELSIDSGRVHPGDDFAFVGFGGGISTGLGVFTL